MGLVSRDDTDTETAEAYRPEDWLSASETIRLVRAETLSRRAHIAIATRAHAGLLRTRADLLIVNNSQRHRDTDVASGFWWAEGQDALTQNWQMGDFETWIDRRVRYQAFGVKFHRDGVAAMVPTAAIRDASPPSSKEAGGRPMSSLWPNWVAELVALIHEEGLPAQPSGTGADDLISRVGDRLAGRGLEGPSRSTIQETVRAVLRRLREVSE
jgi:hypothetical protein